VKSSQDDRALDTIGHQFVPQSVFTEKRTYHSTSDVSSSHQSPTQFVSATHSHAPETPLPATLSLSEALRRQGDESKSPAISSTDEQQGACAEQREDRSTVGSDLSVATALEGSQTSEPTTLVHEHPVTSDPLISIRLLKDVSMTINVPGGEHVIVPLTLNAKRVQLLAYIAWRRGELIDRDKILEHVFGWGLSDEEASDDKLSERFESHKKLLRRKIREVVIEHINKPAGREVIDPDLDPFASDSGFWGLADICRVDDLEVIEANYKPLSLARKDGKLVDEIPEHIKESCERLIASYPGDFLETLIKKYPGEFRSWDSHRSWACKPYTHYRDCYLDALWYAAEYEWRMGQRCADESDGETEEVNQRKQQEYFGRAAQKYQSYALYACNSKFDTKVTFGTHGEFGERVGMSERALRRCVVLLGAISRTDLVNQVWSAYYTQMRSISERRWEPSKETQADVQAARAQTSAYRFAVQAPHLSSEFTEQRDRVPNQK